MLKTIYTANFNNYDSMREPAVITPGWRYVYFTNNENIKSSKWDIVKVDDCIKDKTARFLKTMNPFRHHEVSIWVDASILINTNLDSFVTKYGVSDFNLMNHPHRNCIYKEAKECIKRRKDDSDVILAQMEKYEKMQYPAHNGMVATGIMIRRKSERVNEFCEKWWDEIQHHSKRDQLSFNFVNWQFPINYSMFPFEVLKREFILHKHLKNG